MSIPRQKRPLIAGLTGSIGMGKSTTAAMFADAGIPVWDADATVHALYGPGAAGTAAIHALNPDAVTEAGVDRSRLRAAILADPALLGRIEAAIHPLVARDRSHYIDTATAEGADIILCDIPLLFETGAETGLDRIIVVTASPDIQRQRVLARPGMTPQAFAAILAKQTPDAEKRARAHEIIDTGLGLDHARQRVRQIIATFRGAPDA